MISHYSKSILSEEDEKELSLKGEDEANLEVLKMLRRHGLVPVKGGSTTSLVGQGAFSQVYDVLYKGEHAIAKVTSVSPREILAMIEMMKMRSRLPKQYRRHVLEVYNAFRDNLPYGNVWVAVVEPLVPLSKSVVSAFWETDVDVGKDPQSYHNVRKSVTDDILSRSALVSDKIEDVIGKNKGMSFLDPADTSFLAIEIAKFVTDPKSREYFRPSADTLSVMEAFGNEVEKIVRKFCVDNGLDVRSVQNIFLGDDIYEELIDSIRKVTVGPFPTRAKSYEDRVSREIFNERLKTDPEMSSFMAFIKYIKKSLGPGESPEDVGSVVWEDLHKNNVMVRPFTGDYVLSDPGCFDFFSGTGSKIDLRMKKM
jgi:hypothetical protein